MPSFKSPISLVKRECPSSISFLVDVKSVSKLLLISLCLMEELGLQILFITLIHTLKRINIQRPSPHALVFLKTMMTTSASQFMDSVVNFQKDQRSHIVSPSTVTSSPLNAKVLMVLSELIESL